MPQGPGPSAQAQAAVGVTARAECEQAEPVRARAQRIGWARLLERVFDIDLRRCPSVILLRGWALGILSSLASDGGPLRVGFARFRQTIQHARVSTMNISLPDTLKSLVDEQVSQRGFGTSSEYVRELIRRDQDRLLWRNLLLAGASSAAALLQRTGAPTTPAASRASISTAV